MRNNIYICGYGNVGQALSREFFRHRIQVNGIYSRREDIATANGERICRYDVDFPEDESLVFITVPDRYIGETEKQLGKSRFYPIHTAGSVDIDVLSAAAKGVFYPLQTFSPGVKVQWEKLPVLIETNDEELLEALYEVVAAFGASGIDADSRQRSAVHLAAVFANNFANAMFDMAENLAMEAGLPVQILSPLIHQTVKKLDLLHADQAQTGPAKRGDVAVIDEHLSMLKDKPEYREVYQAISNYLMNKYQRSV